MHILLLFLDGIGLGDDDPAVNPFAVADTPTLFDLAGGHRWLRKTGLQESDRAIFIPTDPRMNVPGRPQSASGQATILTGTNIPQIIGEHYGPKPNEAIRSILAEDNFFKRVVARGEQAALLDAYPPRLLHDFERGKTLRSSIQQAAYESGQRLFSTQDLIARNALIAEWTGDAWHKHLGITEIPLLTPYEAGQLMVELSRKYAFALHSHWMTDLVGHRGPFERGVELLELFDGVMTGVLDTWDDDEGLIIITSDHGNMEEIGNRKHTENDVPTVIIGNARHTFAEGFNTLADIVPRMESLLFD
ncbi:MAG: hypothetical protein D6737_19150 [Chloroflexi bacterium]|nr:MAG: hypothetical protein CUN54_06745 [Phototrophicales bacterium]RMF76929.1 MAG: hypothetical protein D6737_19150 [Chloroflexota bacterium]